MQVSHPLDVFVTNNTERQILDIFVTETAKVSPRKRKAATELAVSIMRQVKAPKFPHALAQALISIEKSNDLN